MSHFSYKAINNEGVVVKGAAENVDVFSVYEALSNQGLHVIQIRKKSFSLSALDLSFFQSRVTRNDVIEFSRNLSVMLKAGVPILSSLDDISLTLENRCLKEALLDIRRKIELGMSLSESLEAKGRLFPEILVRLTKVGEETGRLERSLSDVADHLQKMEDLAKAIKRAIIYPVFSIVTTLGAMLFWFTYVLPKIMEVMKDMGVQLPLMTRMLLAVSEIFQSYWFLVPLLPISFAVIIMALKRNLKTRYYLDMIKLKIPILKLITGNKLLAVFSEQMRILYAAGIVVDRSLDISAEAVGNEAFRRSVSNIKEQVLAGKTLSEAMSGERLFPVLATRMISIGESSGNLEEQFVFLAEYFSKKLDDISHKIGAMMEPIVTVAVGLLFAFIIMGLLFPVYDLISNIGKG